MVTSRPGSLVSRSQKLVLLQFYRLNLLALQSRDASVPHLLSTCRKQAESFFGFPKCGSFFLSIDGEGLEGRPAEYVLQIIGTWAMTEVNCQLVSVVALVYAVDQHVTGGVRDAVVAVASRTGGPTSCGMTGATSGPSFPVICRPSGLPECGGRQSFFAADGRLWNRRSTVIRRGIQP
ncbi:hypothetical protein QTP88_009032 [Uroleucon formosanum]